MTARRHILRAGVLAAASTVAFGTTAPARATRNAQAVPRKPLIIWHRGASGYRPEHTLASFIRAGIDGMFTGQTDVAIVARDLS